MKKALAIISALALVSAVAFAEDGVKISGQVETGIQAQTGDGADYVKTWETDAPGTTRIDLDINATHGDTGLWYKLRSADGASAPTIANFKVYANLFQNMVTVTAGNPDDNAWKTDADADFTAENGYGVRVDVHPVAGLTLGAKLNTPASANLPAKYATGEMSFGGKYTAEKFFIAGGYKLDSKADDTDSDTMATGTKLWGYDVDTDLATLQAIFAVAKATAAPKFGADDFAMGYFGFGYTGIENLLIQAEAKFENLGAYSDIGLATMDEVVEYKVSDPIKVGLCMYQYLPGNSDVSSSLSFKPYANYKYNDITLLKAEIGYKTNAGYLDGVNNFWVSPGAEFQITPNSQIRADYTYTIANMGDEDQYKAQGLTGASIEKTSYSTVNLGFRYSF